MQLPQLKKTPTHKKSSGPKRRKKRKSQCHFRRKYEMTCFRSRRSGHRNYAIMNTFHIEQCYVISFHIICFHIIIYYIFIIHLSILSYYIIFASKFVGRTSEAILMKRCSVFTRCVLILLYMCSLILLCVFIPRVAGDERSRSYYTYLAASVKLRASFHILYTKKPVPRL